MVYSDRAAEKPEMGPAPIWSEEVRMALAKIIVIEDDDALATLLEYNLSKEGFEVSVATDGQEGLLLLRERPPDIIVLDWMLPETSGLEICRQIRARAETAHTPVIMLTARAEEADRIRGFDTGVDDYVTKPFSVNELTARIKAILRRTHPNMVTDIIQVGDIEIDRAAHRVRRNGVDIKLGPTEFRLLEHLAGRPGRVFSREQLLNAVWGQDVYVEIRTVDVHVGRLRKALNQNSLPNPIRTVRSAGYSLEATL